MGLFDRLRGKAESKDYGVLYEAGKLYAPITGTYIPLEEIPDPVFSQGILGPGCGIEPEEGTVYAPVDGTISTIADTKHAVGISSANGEELLIHVGMDTVSMNGKGFQLKVKTGDKVKAGQPLMDFDMEAIKAAGYPTVTAFILANADQYPNMNLRVGEHHAAKEEVGTV